MSLIVHVIFLRLGFLLTSGSQKSPQLASELWCQVHVIIHKNLDEHGDSVEIGCVQCQPPHWLWRFTLCTDVHSLWVILGVKFCQSLSVISTPFQNDFYKWHLSFCFCFCLLSVPILWKTFMQSLSPWNGRTLICQWVDIKYHIGYRAPTPSN